MELIYYIGPFYVFGTFRTNTWRALALWIFLLDDWRIPQNIPRSIVIHAFSGSEVSGSIFT